MENLEKEPVKEGDLEIEQVQKGEGELAEKMAGLAGTMAELDELRKISSTQAQADAPNPTPENSAPLNGMPIAISKIRAKEITEVLSPEEQKTYLAALVVKANAVALETLIERSLEGATAEEIKDLASAAATVSDILQSAAWNKALLDRIKDRIDLPAVQKGPQGQLTRKLVGKAQALDKMDAGDGRATEAKLREEVLGPQDD